MALNKSNGPITILKSGNSAIISVAKLLLEEAAIKFFIKSEKQLDIITDNIISPVEIQVDYTQVNKARTLLADLEEINFEE